MIGIGIIGMGFMGRTHLAAFQQDRRCRVAMICDTNVDRLKSQQPPIGGNLVSDTSDEEIFEEGTIEVTDELDRLLDDPGIDAVSITTPTDSHIELACRSLDAGKHVLLEKPVALTPEGVFRIAHAARSAGRMVMPAHCMRFWPGWPEMRTAILQQQHGAIERMSLLRMGGKPSWSQDFYLDPSRSGGAIIDLHIHDADFICWCLGMPGHLKSTGSINHVTTEYFYEQGPDVTAEGGWLDGDDVTFRMECTLEFPGATMSFDLSREPTLQLETGDGVTDIPVDPGTGYQYEAAAFLGAIEKGELVGPVKMEDAAMVAAVLQAELESLDGGHEAAPVLETS
ncbi:MAG: hypothetical protein CMJ32_05590 [Phycisphaerae bacterium]|nr:hypothetical protein [Phycisphaerae bacterium]